MDEILNTWLEDTKRALIANYDRLGLRASGQWAETLAPFKEISRDKIKTGIEGQDYTFWIENGRKPNADQIPEAIRAWVGWAGSTFIDKWVKDKGINANPYAVAYKIARAGWSVPNTHNSGGLVSDVVTNERIQELNRNLILYVIQEFKSTIIKTLK